MYKTEQSLKPIRGMISESDSSRRGHGSVSGAPDVRTLTTALFSVAIISRSTFQAGRSYASAQYCSFFTILPKCDAHPIQNYYTSS